MIEKQIRWINTAYLKFVKEQPCAICGGAPCDAHHTVSVGAGGSDYGAISLCRGHHQECHSVGKKTFQDLKGISFSDEIIKLLIKYIRR